jgi:cytochrome c-type biogenesis protein CcmF
VTATAGSAALLAGLFLASFGAVTTAVGAWRGVPRLVRLGRLAAFGLLPAGLAAAAALEFALLTHDFSLEFVARNGSRSTPPFYTAISLWSALEGSIVLWVVVLAGFIAAAAWLAPRRVPALYPAAQAVMLLVATFFFWLVTGPADPFRTLSPVPADGPGPNPLLQNNPLMAVHPPFLYLGLVGFTVPFAFAVAALVTGRLDDAWIRATRGATLVAWSGLALGNILGAAWSYQVLGWGGYFAWDPVENAALLPWLTATAYLHSLQVQEKRGMLKLWNLTLLVATFALTLLATFLTRSGVLSSVHAFSNGLTGPALLVFIALVLLGSTALLVWRAEQLRAEGTVDGVVTRESGFLLNNLLLVGLTLTVLVGTLFPIVAEAATGDRLSVGEPYFNQTAIPIAIALLFLMGIGPALPWRKTSRGVLRRRLGAPAAAALFVAAVLAVAGVREPEALVAIALAAFVIAQVAWDLWRIAARGGLARQRRRVGGQLVHAGVALLAVGIAVSSTYRVEREATLSRGDSFDVGGRDRLPGRPLRAPAAPAGRPRRPPPRRPRTSYAGAELLPRAA